MRITLKKSAKKVTLSQSDYIAGGGEGKVYGKGGSAFKIYHDPKKMIPVSKIKELSQLSPKNVLSPRDIILDSSNKPIGFQMDLIPDSIFLTWMFNKGWKQSNNITPDILLHIVRIMRETTIVLHNENCIIGDYNEMQFLVSKDYDNVFFVDTDSYQTASFPCTAIMETVRDRIVPFGTFTTNTDWFAYAIVTFQLWTGIHPYMCKHPNYSRKDVKSFKMMDDNVSAYSKGSSMPKQALPLNVIPKKLDRWYRSVFVDKERTTPPNPDSAMPVAIPKKTIISSTENFNVEAVATAPDTIRKVFIVNGQIYLLTNNTITKNGKVVSRINKNMNYFICECEGSYHPIICKYNGVTLKFYGLENGEEIGSCPADQCIEYNSKIYTVNDGVLYRNQFRVILNKVFHETEITEQLYGKKNIRSFKGTVYQDVLGVPWFVLLGDSTINVQIKELENHRILDAKYDVIHKDGKQIGILMVISESTSNYYRSAFVIDSKISLLSKDNCYSSDQANFVALDKGVIVYVDESDIVLELPGIGAKKVNNPPFDNSNSIYTDGARVLVVQSNRLLHVSMKG